MEWLLVVAALAVGVPAAAWFAQDSLIFYPQPLSSEPRLSPRSEPLEIVAADGIRLRGWLRAADRAPAPAVLYFGGNAEEVSATLADPRWPPDWSIVAVNYRGYGRSEGRPSEQALVADARTIHDILAGRPDIDPRCIVAFGRSLGSGVAVKLAAARPLCALILVSPFDSLVALGSAHFRWLPVSLLLRHRFELLADARQAQVPLLALVAQQDSIVPRDRSAALYDAWAGPRTWRELRGTGHNSVSEPDEFWAHVAAFLARVKGMPAPE